MRQLKMDLMIKNYLDRARNELLAAEILKKSSEERDTKEHLSIKETTTFYSPVISHSYYAIFYSAKALLLTKKIKTSSPDVHKKTFDMFKKNFVDTSILDNKLLEIYNEAVVRAD